MLALSDGTSAVPVNAGWDDLSLDAFALWIRLHTLMRPQRELGLEPLAKLLNVNRHTLKRKLVELRRRGYVRTVKVREGSRFKIKIALTRRANLPTVSDFVRI